MIIDSLANASAWFCVHPLFEKAFDYIKSVNMENAVPGINIIEEGSIKAIFAEQCGVSEATSVAEFECHNQYIDIQLCISGKERFGWRPRKSCIAPAGEYDADKDVLLYNDQPTMFFELCAGQFVILFPEDVHAPLIAINNEAIKKLVLKIKR